MYINQFLIYRIRRAKILRGVLNIQLFQVSIQQLKKKTLKIHDLTITFLIFSLLFFLASDGRVIVFGGISNGLPALPHMPILDTSKTPYEWSTPTVENPIGSFSSHTAVMAKNYMIF